MLPTFRNLKKDFITSMHIEFRSTRNSKGTQNLKAPNTTMHTQPSKSTPDSTLAKSLQPHQKSPLQIINLHTKRLHNLPQLSRLPNLLHPLQPSSQIISNLVILNRPKIPPRRLRTILIRAIMQPPPQARQIARHLLVRAEVDRETRILGEVTLTFALDAREPGEETGEVEVRHGG